MIDPGKSAVKDDPVAGSVVCILNAMAGSSRAAAQRDHLTEIFSRHGRPVSIVLARRGDGLVRAAKAAVAQRSPLVLAAGGDGTINAVAGALIGTGTTLGLLPLGTLNHFAKDLKIPLKLEDAVATAFAGRTADVDVGEVNGRIFLNNSSLGLYPGLVHIRETLQRGGYGKWPAFARALLFALWRYSPLTVELTADDKGKLTTTTPFVFIGNNKYELAAPHAGERASLTEGKLWVYQAPHAGRAKLVGLALRALVGRQNPADLIIIESEAFRIRTRAKRLRVAIDGEVCMLATPLQYRINPRALRVMVPAEIAAS